MNGGSMFNTWNGHNKVPNIVLLMFHKSWIIFQLTGLNY